MRHIDLDSIVSMILVLIAIVLVAFDNPAWKGCLAFAAYFQICSIRDNIIRISRRG